MPDFTLENNLHGHIAGVDEAGRGPWAGPVVAGAVIFRNQDVPKNINDSKKLSKKHRENLFKIISEIAIVGVGIANVDEIDEFNILGATKLAMQRAVNSLSVKPNFVLVDGNQLPNLPYSMTKVVKGDSISMSIAAASIIAKVTRDNIMNKISQDYPAYKWEKNSGYGTKDHNNAILKFGITEHHRKSFKPIAIHLKHPSILLPQININH